jgi:tetratricopeptide (TPR) repeat protein
MKLTNFLRGAGTGEVLIGIFALLVLGLLFRVQMLDLYEDAAYKFDSSPQRAFAYGERHFDAQNANEYDIRRAAYFFALAAAQDPTLPYLYHELARISFLEGDFKTALARINFQISLHGDSEPNSYYIRGLIEGYMGDYAPAAKDYEHFLQFDPNDWAAMNDYAWVLLKANRPQDAVRVTLQGLTLFPDNPWLLNSNSIALYEIGDLKDAYSQAQHAVQGSQRLTQSQWLHAYPGNDPGIAAEGVAAFQKAAADNMHTIQLALASSTVQ